MSKSLGGSIFTLLLWLLFFIGYVRCIYKFVNCDFNPIGKAEIVYGVGSVTGIGGIVGYFDIEDK